jgi:hypothetical protein
MIDTEKYQPARHNMKFVTRSLRSLANNFIFWLGRLIFSVSINSHILIGYIEHIIYFFINPLEYISSLVILKLDYKCTIL